MKERTEREEIIMGNSILKIVKKMRVLSLFVWR